MSRIPGEDYHPPHGAKATPPTVDAIARVLVDQDREIRELRARLEEALGRVAELKADVTIRVDIPPIRGPRMPAPKLTPKWRLDNEQEDK